MDTAFVIGNGESRNIFPIEHLKGKGIVYGCNAIYRDHPTLCDHIVAVNPAMYLELKKWHNTEKSYDELRRHPSLPKDLVDDYIAGQKAIADTQTADIQSVAGGRQQYGELIEWAGWYLNSEERTAFNDLIAGFKKRSLMLEKTWEVKDTKDNIEFRRRKQKMLDLRNRKDTLGNYHKTIEFIVDNVIIHVTTVDDTTAWTPHADEKLEDAITAMSTQFPNIQAGINMNTLADIQIHGIDDISSWDYVCEGDTEDEVPIGLKIYRMWRGGDVKKGKGIRTMDFSKSRGSGMSAVLLAAESGIKNVVMLAFDILGARQWEMETPSREQNNIYKNTINYPDRMSMKAYLKYEWMYQLRQIIRKHPNTNFHFINRREYIEGNMFLRWYFDQPNIRTGIYADLKRWIDGQRDDIKWMRL